MEPSSGGDSIEIRKRLAALEAENSELKASLRQANDIDRYWTLIRMTPVPMFVTCDDRVVLVNPAAVAALGASSESRLIGRSPLEFIPPDRRDYVQLRVNEAGSRGSQTSMIEERFSRLDGSMLDVEVTVWAVTYDGKPALQVMFSDISARKKAERALRESERIYRGVGEMIDYGVWICDPQGNNIYASESFLRLVGQTQAECSEFGWGKVLHPDDAERTIAAWKECARTGGTWDIEHRFLGVDGRYHPILARGVPVRDDDGNIVCWAGINLDISRLKRTEEELARSNADLERFADVVAHDLQAPLRSVSAFSELLVRRYSNQVAGGDSVVLEHIQNGIRSMNELVRGLLAYSRATRPHTNRLPVDANRILDSVRIMFREQIDGCGAVIESDPLPTLSFDESHLLQVFQNLIGNALKYRGPGASHIRVSAREESGEWIFSVIDNGPGIDAKDHDRIFEMFRRLHGDHVPGAGIGLAVCKRLVVNHGGRIWVESAIGEGSRFYFTVPH